MGGGAPGRRAGPELEAAWAWGAAEGRMWPGAPVEAGLGLGAEGTGATHAEVGSDPLWGCLSHWWGHGEGGCRQCPVRASWWVPRGAGS